VERVHPFTSLPSPLLLFFPYPSTYPWLVSFPSFTGVFSTIQLGGLESVVCSPEAEGPGKAPAIDGTGAF